MPQEDENWNPEAVWKHLRYQTTERWLDERGDEFRPYTHYNVGGNTKFWGSVLYRLRREDFQAARAHGRRLAGVADRLRHARAVLRARRAPVSGARRARRRSDRTRRAARFRTRRFRTPPAMAAIVEQLRAQGLHPSPLPLGLRDGCVLCNTCNSFACKVHAKSEADVCCVRPALERPNVDALDQRVRAPADHRTRPATVEAVEVERERRDGSRRGVARRRVVRRGELGGAAAAIGERQAPERAREFVGARRPPLHGAPRDDDAGVPSVPEERDGVPEDRRDQRLLFSRAARRRIRSARSSRRDARTA